MKRNTETVILSMEIVLGNVGSSSTTHITIYPQHNQAQVVEKFNGSAPVVIGETLSIPALLETLKGLRKGTKQC